MLGLGPTSGAKPSLKGFAFGVFSLLFLCLVLGLMLVWLNIERVDLAYEMKSRQGVLEQKHSLVNKLMIERDNLMSPNRLREMAGRLELGPAQPGQIRRIKAQGE